MLVFLAANLGLKGDRLQSTMKMTHEIRQVGSVRTLLAWSLRLRGDKRIFYHGGTTFGYESFAGFVTETRTGVVVLSNSHYGIQDIGRHLLDPSVPLHDIAAPPWFLLFTALGVAVAVVLWLIWKAGSVVWLSRCERAVCAAAAGWLALLALAAASEGNLLQGRLLAPLPIVLLLALPRRRAVRLTAALTGFAWIFVLAAIMPAVPGPIIGYFDLLLLLSIAATCGLWIGLNLTLLANRPRRLWWYVVGGLVVVPVLALIQPFVLPLHRAAQGQYLWALLLAAAIAVVLAGAWWLAVRLTGAREPRLGWRGALGQLGYWSLFLACLAVFVSV